MPKALHRYSPSPFLLPLRASSLLPPPPRRLHRSRRCFRRRCPRSRPPQCRRCCAPPAPYPPATLRRRGRAPPAAAAPFSALRMAPDASVGAAATAKQRGWVRVGDHPCEEEALAGGPRTPQRRSPIAPTGTGGRSPRRATEPQRRRRRPRTPMGPWPSCSWPRAAAPSSFSRLSGLGEVTAPALQPGRRQPPRSLAREMCSPDKKCLR
jgi:hypothetical protein